MPAKINRHGDCRLDPLATTLRSNLGITLQSVRASVHEAVVRGNEERADHLRADQLALGELLGQVDGIMKRHHESGLSEQRGELELAEVRRGHEAIIREGF